MTSPIAGTTRDALEAWVHIAGVGVTLIDTAGLRETADPLEAEGVRRAREKAACADLIIHVAEAGCAESPGEDPRTLWVVNKIDLVPAQPGWIGVSVLTGQGLAGLREALVEAVLRLTRTASPAMSQARHHAALIDAASCLGRALVCDLPELRGAKNFGWRCARLAV